VRRGGGAARLGWQALAAWIVLLCAAPATARVLRVEIDARRPLLAGQTFGERGSYEWLSGRVVFGLDPASPANARITDLTRAPRNAQGLVEAEADLIALQPADPARRRGVALVEVVNRGRMLALATLNRAALDVNHPRRPDPERAEDWGDGLLMRLGLTVIWIGWQFDAADDGVSLRLRAPAARGAEGEPLRGWVRADWVIEERADTLPLAAWGHVPYPAAAPDDPRNALSVRDGRESPRRPVPRERWAFGSMRNGQLVPDPGAISLRGGFEVGRIYELVYLAQDPPVAGVGLAALRDVLSYARHDPDCPFPVRRGVAFGLSQSGRVLRQLLYDGLNTDEQGRGGYDGMLIGVAGAGRGSFNHRFAQPGRAATRYRSFFYPIDLFPFATRPQLDAGRTEGLLDRVAPGHAPRILQLNGGHEYWARAASLIHTTADASEDLAPVEHERVYHLASAPHAATPFPPDPGAQLAEGVYRGNPIELAPTLRALLVRLLAWLETGAEPPASRVPRLADASLVALEQLAPPRIPGLVFPRAAHVAYRTDYGPRWSQGIIDREPPEVGAPFPTRVPALDALGNESPGIRPLEVRVPLATYAPWSLRTGYPGEAHEMADFLGTWVPLPRTPAERAARGDPRPSVAELYASEAAYLERVEKEAQALVAEGFLLADDVALERERARARWAWVNAPAESTP
jgi:hypothetical protein